MTWWTVTVMADLDVERLVDCYAQPSLADGVRLAIVGSVAFAHSLDWHQAGVAIRRSIQHLQPVQIISGGARGIDTLAARIGREMGIEVVEFLPQVRSWADEGGFRDRNRKIAEACTHLLRVWCRSSRTYGSGWTADLAERLGKDVRRYSPCLAVAGSPREAAQQYLFGEVSRA